jgi:protein gp37
MSTIEWTDETWNPVVGCSRVSAGCDHCYAMGAAHRKMSPAHHGLTKLRPKDASRPGVDWTGTVRTLPLVLWKPLRWRKPRRIFVNSMSDLFHEAVPMEFIAAVFGVMLMASHHTYQVLTKRDPRRFFAWLQAESVRFEKRCKALAHANGDRISPDPRVMLCVDAAEDAGVISPDLAIVTKAGDAWPPRSVWLGTSVEDQATANERIPRLLDVDAALHFVSYEPALGPVDFAEANVKRHIGRPQLGWVIVGGESGPGARPFDIAWARRTVADCKRAGVPVFVKQLGERPHEGDFAKLVGGVWTWAERGSPYVHTQVDRKGGDMAEWPADLRVREMPT